MTARVQDFEAVKDSCPPDGLPSPYLRPAQVAELLQVSEKSIYRWVKSQGLPAVRIGGVLRFHSVRLERWLQAREQRPRSRKLLPHLVKSAPSGSEGSDCAHPCAPAGAERP